MTNSTPLVPRLRRYLLASLGCILAGHLSLAQAQLSEESLGILATMAPNAPAPGADSFVHIPPTMADLEASSLHPELKGSSTLGVEFTP